jgi:hypothetical protein
MVQRYLAEHDVAGVAGADGVHPFEGLRRHLVVLVDELDVLTVRLLDPDVAGLARPAGVLLVEDPHVRVFCRQLVQAGGRVVGGAVVDEDDLVLLRREALVE